MMGLGETDGSSTVRGRLNRHHPDRPSPAVREFGTPVPLHGEGPSGGWRPHELTAATQQDSGAKRAPVPNRQRDTFKPLSNFPRAAVPTNPRGFAAVLQLAGATLPAR
jgi:hypothetical protein